MSALPDSLTSGALAARGGGSMWAIVGSAQSRVCGVVRLSPVSTRNTNLDQPPVKSPGASSFCRLRTRFWEQFNSHSWPPLISQATERRDFLDFEIHP